MNLYDRFWVGEGAWYHQWWGEGVLILPSREASSLQCVERCRHESKFTTHLETVIVHLNIKHSRTVISELVYFISLYKIASVKH